MHPTRTTSSQDLTSKGQKRYRHKQSNYWQCRTQRRQTVTYWNVRINTPGTNGKHCASMYVNCVVFKSFNSNRSCNMDISTSFDNIIITVRYYLTYKTIQTLIQTYLHTLYMTELYFLYLQFTYINLYARSI